MTTAGGFSTNLQGNGFCYGCVAAVVIEIYRYGTPQKRSSGEFGQSGGNADHYIECPRRCWKPIIGPTTATLTSPDEKASTGKNKTSRKDTNVFKNNRSIGIFIFGYY